MQKRFTPDAGGVFPEWEEKTIEEACNVNVSNGTPGDKFIYIELGDVNKYGLLKRKNLVRKNEAPVSAKRVAKIDDVFFRSVRPGNKGHFHYTNEMSEQVVMSSAFFQLSMKDGDNEFLYQTLNTQYFTKQVLTRCTGTTYPTISLNEFIKLKIKIPKSMEEQRKIAAALAAYDEMIAVKTAKLETWQECKKRMVKDIFGRTKRFRDDDGNEFPEWEEKMLGEVCKYGNTHKTGKNYINVENMNKDFSGVTFLEPSLERKGIVYDVGDVLMSNIRPYLRKAWLADRSGICDSDVLVFHLKDGVDIDSTFLYYTIASSELVKWAMIGARGTKMPRCDKQHLMEKRIFLPCKEEQQKIGSFLAEIDKEIEIQKEFIKTYAEGKKRMMKELME